MQITKVTFPEDSLHGQAEIRRLSLAKRRIAIIGLNILDDHSPVIIAALRRRLAVQTDWQVIFTSEAYYESIQLAERLGSDGILARIVTDKMAEEALKVTCPVVNISSLLENPGVPTVRRDDRNIGELCAKHLLDRGFERFGILTESLNDWCFRSSEEGFLDELKRSGKNKSVSRFGLDRSSQLGNCSELRHWLHCFQRPFALVLVGDRFAFDVLNLCKAEGFIIPRDVGIVTTASHAPYLAPCNPTITHPEPDGEWIINPACDYLAELIDNPAVTRRSIECPVPRLVIGESSNTLAVDDPVTRIALDFLEASFQLGINVSDVVRKTGVSRRFVERRFLASTGKSIHEFLTERRLALAKELLASSPKEKLSTVATMVGFREEQAFRAAFIRLTGATPSAWQKNYRTSKQ